jgi:predicted nucleic acid-binding protein
MRIVLDTNVLVAGLLSATGPPGWILEAVLAGDVDLAFDMGIRQEYDEVLRRQELGLPAGRVAALLEVIDELGFEVVAAPRWPVGMPDPDDAPCLAVAAVAGSVVVTGNLRHFPVRCRRGVTVLTPRQFVETRGGDER